MQWSIVANGKIAGDGSAAVLTQARRGLGSRACDQVCHGREILCPSITFVQRGCADAKFPERVTGNIVAACVAQGDHPRLANRNNVTYGGVFYRNGLYGEFDRN